MSLPTFVVVVSISSVLCCDEAEEESPAEEDEFPADSPAEEPWEEDDSKVEIVSCEDIVVEGESFLEQPQNSTAARRIIATGIISFFI